MKASAPRTSDSPGLTYSFLIRSNVSAVRDGYRYPVSAQSNHRSSLNGSHGGAQGLFLGFSGFAGKCDKNYRLSHHSPDDYSDRIAEFRRRVSGASEYHFILPGHGRSIPFIKLMPVCSDAAADDLNPCACVRRQVRALPSVSDQVQSRREEHPDGLLSRLLAGRPAAAASLLFFRRKRDLLIRRRDVFDRGLDPDLDRMHLFGLRSVEFAMNDSCPGRHRLHFVGSKNVSFAHAVPMQEIGLRERR